MFELNIYQLHLPSVRNDTVLQNLFSALPPQCLVLLEDIDAVGAKRDIESDDSDSDDDDESAENVQTRIPGNPRVWNDNAGTKKSRCTLSGLLNVIDGITSQEGRILIMTSNVPDKLDAALTRPGRIDKMIYLSEISKDSAKNVRFLCYRSTTHDAAVAFHALSVKY